MTQIPLDKQKFEKPEIIHITSSFTIEPILPGLKFWIKELKYQVHVELAPYNQVFQQLLSNENMFIKNDTGMNVIIIRFEDWIRDYEAIQENTADRKLTEQMQGKISGILSEFVKSLKSYSTIASCHTLLLLCPSPVYTDGISKDFFTRQKRALLESIEGINGITFICAEDFHEIYSIGEFYDPVRDKMGHIPFIPGYYDFLSTLIIRRYYALKNKAFKVIALDCDNTLWEGVCGESGPGSVRIDGAFFLFQEFLVKQSEQGMLLCLCSKNNEEDVWNVFDVQKQMPLKRQNIVASRINWEQKSDNLRSLAHSLNLGLDSFILIDDNPVECAEVRANCPEVLVIQWPGEEKAMLNNMHHYWVFDHYVQTEEDTKRTSLYRANIAREELRGKSIDFKDFLESLQLQIRIRTLENKHVQRVSQLTGRTNQFNFTSRRWPEEQVKALLTSKSMECLTVEVEDRFGSYGLTGVMIYERKADTLEVDTFLLSCRILGRGVEYKMVSELGKIAQAGNLGTVKLIYKKTPKNKPAGDFLLKIGEDLAKETDENTIECCLPVSGIVRLDYSPENEHRAGKDQLPGNANKETDSHDSGISQGDKEVQLAEISRHFLDQNRLSTEIHGTPGDIYTIVKKDTQAKMSSYDTAILEVISCFSQELLIPGDSIHPETELSQYNMDSFKIIEITARLAKKFPGIPTTLLFEQGTIKKIVDYLMVMNKDQLIREGKISKSDWEERKIKKQADSEYGEAFLFPDSKKDDIAVIGIGCRFPKSPDPDEFWENLKNGISCITEISDDRWGIASIFNPQGIHKGKSYSKWGGMIEDVDKFDAAFFHLSPREAETMDPQQRIFLEIVWNTLEDAGYTPSTIGKQTGVFVGVISSDYCTISNEAALHGNCIYRNSDYYQIPNRISYFFNFSGPSMAVDTACSASATAVHLACESLKKGECKCAVAGGVNLFLHPGRYIQYSQMEFMSYGNECKPFGADADGTIFGEGAAAVLLKPLADAEHDGDIIYGVIKGTAINSGGKTNGFTVPNPLGQAELIRDCIVKAGIDSRTISYIEAHGTGTPLGDPIEIRGLTLAFKESNKHDDFSSDTEFCSIASVKSNIGHLESGAALAGLVKVLLQMKYRKIVPSVNTEKLNPLIPFNQTPFYVQKTFSDWKNPILTIEGKSVKFPRRAGISSFGAGGSNAHIIAEEYKRGEGKKAGEKTQKKDDPVILVLSGKTKENLLNRAKLLLKWLSKKENRDADPRDIAYTLQVGREEMEERLGIIAGSIKEFEEKLKGFADGKNDMQGVFTGCFEKGSKDAEFDAIQQDTLQIWIQEKRYDRLLNLWIKGLVLDWNILYGTGKPERISLPAYPFTKERYWIDESGRSFQDTGISKEYIHPLLHHNTSTFTEQRFSSLFSGNEFFLADYYINNNGKAFPGAIYLEMARAAVEAAIGTDKNAERKICFKNVEWVESFFPGQESIQLHTGLTLGGKGEIHFEIYGLKDTCKVIIYFQGTAELCEAENRTTIDLRELKERKWDVALSSAEFYKMCAAIGREYGPGYRGIEVFYSTGRNALARLSVPVPVSYSAEQYGLHPSIIDGVFQVISGVMQGTGINEGVIPFAIDHVEISGNCLQQSWVAVSLNEKGTGNTFDVDVCDDSGNISIRILGLAIRQDTRGFPFEVNKETGKESSGSIDKDEPFEIMTFEETWEEQPLQDEQSPAETARNKMRNIVFFFSNEKNQTLVEETMRHFGQHLHMIFIVQGEAFKNRSPNRYRVKIDDPGSYKKAFMQIREQEGEVDTVIYCWALEDSNCIRDYSPVVFLLQGVHSAGLHPARYILAGVIKDQVDRCFLESWIGFERSAGLIIPQSSVTVFLYEGEIQGRDDGLKDFIKKIWNELGDSGYGSVYYKEGKRYVCRIKPVELEPGEGIVKRGGTYLITGGTGALGFIFAQHLAETMGVNLVLTGRSGLNEEKRKKLRILKEAGSQALYLTADVADPVQMMKVYKKTRSRFGGINGIIHTAGIPGGKNILEKSIHDFRQVLEPKINGTLVLDKVFDKEQIDFICYFSSSAGVIGDFGSCDYAVANRFLINYAMYRNQLQVAEKRTGKTVVICWPIWKEGGMGAGGKNRMDSGGQNGMGAGGQNGMGAGGQDGMDAGGQNGMNSGGDEATSMYLKSSGQRLLERMEGIELFERFLSQKKTQHLVFAGQKSRVHRFLGLHNKTGGRENNHLSGRAIRGRRPGIKGLSLNECIAEDLIEHICQLLKISRDKIRKEKNWADFGFDSISLREFAKKLKIYYGFDVTPSLFFGYSTIEKLVERFIHDHEKEMSEFYAEKTVSETSKKVPAENTITRLKRKGNRFAAASTGQDKNEPIAIIGMSGRFPASRSIGEMWKILEQGREVITDFPVNRFTGISRGKSRWKCGCIPGIGEFDPLFFEISPREAEQMDPRQRLLLQESWKALEDAGYGPVHIGKNKIGMFVGVEQGIYHYFTGERVSITSNHDGILAARLAYFLGFNGPVIAVNTACSSGLVATHLACLSLWNDECDTAVAAGVNVVLTPDLFEEMSEAGMLSEDGKCYAFDRRANGMVAGEAIAVIVLKKLSRAEEDHDPVYAVIKGSGINYDGKTNGITAPSGVAQKELLKTIYERFAVNPGDIEYIVTHGTGTKLGDPVEVNALNEVFREFTKKQGFCALTSNKTNFGHTLASSGLVSLINLVEAFRHNMIPASLNFEAGNEYINWNDSPFYVNNTNKPWYDKREKRRLGAVSAFGVSGTNVHMILESYPKEDSGNKNPRKEPSVLLVLSARKEETLKEKVRDLIAVLEEKEWNGEGLLNIAYTLIESRKHFHYRCAVLAKDREDAIYTLKKAIENERVPNLFQGKVHPHFNRQRAIEQYIMELSGQIQTLQIEYTRCHEKLGALAELYCQGYDIPWYGMNDENKPRRMNLPTYPFCREEYWTGDSSEKQEKHHLPIKYHHPLLQENTSDLFEQRYSSIFTGNEFFLEDHVVNGRKILPGVAYLEIARAAVYAAAGITGNGNGRLRLKNVVWVSPVVVDEEPVKVNVRVFPGKNDELEYEVYSINGDGHITVHNQGTAEFVENNNESNPDLKALQERKWNSELSREQWYKESEGGWLTLGPRFYGVETVFISDDIALAKLKIPNQVLETAGDYMLHPTIMDSAFQTARGLMTGFGIKKAEVPFALDEIEIMGGCVQWMWAIARCDETGINRKYNIDLCNDAGQICVRMKGLSLRVMESSEQRGVMILEPSWKEEKAPTVTKGPEFETHLVFLCEPGNNAIAGEIEKTTRDCRCITLNPQKKGMGVDERYKTYVKRVIKEIQGIKKEKPGARVLIQGVLFSTNKPQLFSGLMGILLTAQQENPKIAGQIIELEESQSAGEIAERLAENTHNKAGSYIKYQGRKRLIKEFIEIKEYKEKGDIPWIDGGIYLITGGTGGLGRIIASDIAAKVKNPVLFLTGRSKLSSEKESWIRQLGEKRAWCEYIRADITKKMDVEELIQRIYDKYKKLDGIIHCAGVIKDDFLIKKDIEDVEEVLNPKVTGLVNLDNASRQLKPGLFILFSSLSGIIGNPGQADYAAANAFMDAYAAYRNEALAASHGNGKTLSIDWPLWKDGGMKIDRESEGMLLMQTGLAAMGTGDGIQALYRGVSLGRNQIAIAAGNLEQLRRTFLVKEVPSFTVMEKSKESAGSETKGDDDVLHGIIQSALKKDISDFLKINSEELDSETVLSKYGFDSISLTGFANKLNKEYNLDLNPAIFFEYPTIDSLAGFLFSEYRHVWAEQTNDTKGKQTEEPEEVIEPDTKQRQRFIKTITASSAKPDAMTQYPIAIIGISGIFPGAGDADEFWNNLSAGKDSITEIPVDRWDWHKYYGDPVKEINKTNIKWGGFIKGVYDFDPLFFGISPKEAGLMDPAQRLLMMYVWKVLEDAGYSAESLAGTSTGIFIGTQSSGYGEMLFKADMEIEGYSSTGLVPSVGPNRMSYFLNIHGPSEPVETACSSSLVALHRAINAIADKSCDQAVAGGISIILTPAMHISFSKAGMLCEDGRCKTFSDKANGYVRGEGAGMLFLKKLSSAEKDRDHIYGVIKSTAVNHGGRANSFTAPNPKAQAELLVTAYRKAGIDPCTVTYIEAHGTGTSIGDPIEINGLKSAFNELIGTGRNNTVKKPFCGLGSVKTNIGHLELASGAAGIIKILLQLKYKTLVKSLYCENINPYIELKDSPFYIVQEKKEWKALKDGKGNDIPRRAGVSSFGFGGVNAHAVIEEYIPGKVGETPGGPLQKPVVIVLSAKDKENLIGRAKGLLRAIESNGYEDVDLPSIAYTLQAGREAMEERLGFTAMTIPDLKEKLSGFIDGKDQGGIVFRGQVTRNKNSLSQYAMDEDFQNTIENWIVKGKYGKIVDLWVNGLIFDWNKLYGENIPGRLSLPTYTFSRKQYRVEAVFANRKNGGSGQKYLHPLVHENTSDFMEQRFSSVFTGNEFFLSDHKVNGIKILPGVVYLEMVRAAVSLAVGLNNDNKTGLLLKNVVWARPVIAGNEPAKVNIGLEVMENGEIEYEVYSGNEAGDAVVHCQGTAEIVHMDKDEKIEINSLVKQKWSRELSAAECYGLFRKIGIEYGPGHRGIETIYAGEGEVLAKLSIPGFLPGNAGEYILHPSIMDSALQATIGIAGETHQAKVPFALDEVKILGGCSPAMWAVVKFSEIRSGRTEKYDIDICDDKGKLRVRMKGLSVREIKNSEGMGGKESIQVHQELFPVSIDQQDKLMMLTPSWDTMEMVKTKEFPGIKNQLVIIGGTGEDRDVIKTHYPGAVFLKLANGDTIKAISEKMAGVGRIDHIIWIAPAAEPETMEDELLITGQEQGIIQVFRIIKALLGLGFGEMELGFTVVTRGNAAVGKNEWINPVDGGIRGLIGSLAKEYPIWGIRCVDIERNIKLPLEEIFSLAANKDGDQIVIRNGKWYEQKLVSLKYPEIQKTLYREKGVYVVIGGAGELGEIWSDYMIRTYQAKIIWIGRRAIDTHIREKIERLGTLGEPPWYIKADAKDREALERAYKKIKQRYPQINGVIHSALVIQDTSLLNMDENMFRNSLCAKVDVSVRIVQVFKKEPVDFVLFFSSFISFTKDAGQGDYSAGCTFNDSFALRLSHEWDCAIKIINWGYWGKYGSVVRKEYQQKMEKTGISPVEPPEAIDALNKLVSGPINQMALIKIRRN